jgi:hypothetical protein
MNPRTGSSRLPAILMIGGGILLAVSAILYATAPVPTLHMRDLSLDHEGVQTMFAGMSGLMDGGAEYAARIHQVNGSAALGALLFLAGAIVGLTRRWSPTGRLHRLHALHAQGLLTADELAEKRREIVAAV